MLSIRHYNVVGRGFGLRKQSLPYTVCTDTMHVHALIMQVTETEMETEEKGNLLFLPSLLPSSLRLWQSIFAVT